MAEKFPSRGANLQSDSIPFSLITQNQLKQFAAAAAKGYVPQAHSQPVTTAASHSSTASSTPPATAAPAPAQAPAPEPAPAPAPAPATTTTSNSSATTTKPTSSSNALVPSSYISAPYVPSPTHHPKIAMDFKGPMIQPINAETFKGCKYVCLDPLIVDHRDIYEKITGTFQWEMCETGTERCAQFIGETCVNKRVFLVTSGGIGREIVPKIHHIEQLYAIYVYCGHVQGHLEWASKLPKVRMVCDDDDKYLIPQLALDVAQTNLEWAIGLIAKGNKELAKKKLEVALSNVQNHMNNNPQPNMQKEIERRLQECK